MEGFDPDNNEQDRRMLYEVTGMRLNRDEFLDEDSQDSCGDEDGEELLPSDFVFMDRYDEEENDGNINTSLNP